MDFPLIQDAKAVLNITNVKALTLSFVFLLVLYGTYTYLQSSRQRSNFPIVNYDPKAWTDASAKASFLTNCKQLLAEGSKKFSGPFRITTLTGPLILLPADMVDAMNAEKDLSFVEYVKDEFLTDYDTFRTLRPSPPGMLHGAIHKGITRQLPRFSQPLSREMAKCLKEIWGEKKDWSETVITDDSVMCITRLSNIVFLGERFTRNQEWINTAAGFTVKLFRAVAATQSWYPIFRPLVDRFSSLNREVRRDHAAIAAMLKPVLDERLAEIRRAEKEGRKPDLPDDSIEWFRTAANGRDYPNIWLQVGLMQVAIQTTSDVLCQSVLRLCSHPEYVEPLRKEAIEVLSKHGFSKEAMSELRLLDSFIKEALRLKPVTMTSMHRRAMKDVELPGGIKIREGEHLAISSHLMWDESRYADPEKFDGYRFAERRKLPGNEAKNLLVATNVDHLGFAHGKLACPGRFLAANMLKTAMVYFLLWYDIKITDPEEARWWTLGENMLPKIGAKVWMKSRQPEIDLEALTAATLE